MGASKRAAWAAAANPPTQASGACPSARITRCTAPAEGAPAKSATAIAVSKRVAPAMRSTSPASAASSASTASLTAAGPPMTRTRSTAEPAKYSRVAVDRGARVGQQDGPAGLGGQRAGRQRVREPLGGVGRARCRPGAGEDRGVGVRRGLAGDGDRRLDAAAAGEARDRCERPQLRHHVGAIAASPPSTRMRAGARRWSSSEITAGRAPVEGRSSSGLEPWSAPEASERHAQQEVGLGVDGPFAVHADEDVEDLCAFAF